MRCIQDIMNKYSMTSRHNIKDLSVELLIKSGPLLISDFKVAENFDVDENLVYTQAQVNANRAIAVNKSHVMLLIGIRKEGGSCRFLSLSLPSCWGPPSSPALPPAPWPAPSIRWHVSSRRPRR